VISIVLTLALLWFATPANASLLATQTWAWDSVANATGYRVYWGATGKAWCVSNRVEFSSSVCINGECQGEIPIPAYSPVFVMVTAFNQYGEGPTDHGPVAECP
jgi:hypothetical protein